MELKHEKCGTTYQCNNLSDYVFVDVGSDLVGSDYLLEEDDDNCKVNSETLLPNHEDIDYNLVKQVKLERFDEGTSNENEINIQNSDTIVENLYTGNNISGFPTDVCMENICGSNYDKKQNGNIAYTVSKLVSSTGVLQEINVCVKEEKNLEDVLINENTESISSEIKQEYVINNEEIVVANEAVIDIKLSPVIKVERLSNIDEISVDLLGSVKDSGTRNSVFGRYFDADDSANCDEEIEVRNEVVFLKPLMSSELIHCETETHLQSENAVQDPIWSEFEKHHSRGYSATDRREEGVYKHDKADQQIPMTNTELKKNKYREMRQPHQQQKNQQKVSKKIRNKRRLSCDTCGREFKQLCHLKTHQIVHTNDRPFLCSVCGKAMKHQETLARHNLIHTGERPFVCDICGKAFSRQHSVNKHKRTHTGYKPYCCSICGNRFTENSRLKQHRNIHTGETPFGCKLCGKAFRHMSSLDAHKRVHAGNKLFCCNTCGREFTEGILFWKHKCIKTGE